MTLQIVMSFAFGIVEGFILHDWIASKAAATKAQKAAARASIAATRGKR